MNNCVVSIIIPCRNEERFINKCLDSIIANDYSKDRFEILVIDGMSNDKTREIIKEYSNKYSNIKLLDNPKKVTPISMNIGIKASRGDYILILSSHSKIDEKFIKLNVNFIIEKNVDCVGGIIITLPANETVLANSIALALSNAFGVGNAYFRIGTNEIKYVDTVPFGCYKKDVFTRIGYFDEELIRNQDDEFNLRLLKNKGKILLVPKIISYYYARDSLSKLWKMYFQYGYFKPIVAKKVKGILTLRQLIPAIFVSSLIFFSILSVISELFLLILLFILSSYLIANLGFSLSISLKKGLKFLFSLPLIFLIIHFSYGIGYLKSLCDFFILKRYKINELHDVPLTR